MFIEPSWMRLGFSGPPDHFSGKGIGVIIIDDISPHPTIRHLANRLKHVIVENDSITCRDITKQNYNPSLLDKGTHGLMTVLTLTHQSIVINGSVHTGIAPAGNFIVLSHGAFKEGEGERLKRGIDWILENFSHWNIRLILSLGWHAQDNTVFLEETKLNSTVQALAAAVEQGIMVICANGNSDIGTILPPLDYLAVGGFNDQGSADHKHRIPYPGEPFGFNGDGDYRPDIRAPRTRIIIPYCEGDPDESQQSIYTGTSVASTLVSGACMNLLSKFPYIDNITLRKALVCLGDKMTGDQNLAPIINVQRASEAIFKSKTMNLNQLSDTTGIVDRAIRMSRIIRKGGYTRDDLWDFQTILILLLERLQFTH